MSPERSARGRDCATALAPRGGEGASPKLVGGEAGRAPTEAASASARMETRSMAGMGCKGRSCDVGFNRGFFQLN